MSMIVIEHVKVSALPEPWRTHSPPAGMRGANARHFCVVQGLELQTFEV